MRMLNRKEDYYYAYTWGTLRLIYFEKYGNNPMAKVLSLLVEKETRDELKEIKQALDNLEGGN